MTAPRRSTQHAIAAVAAIVLTWLALSASAHCEEVSIAKPSAIYLSLAAADLGSTEWAIRNGASEGNSFMTSQRVPKQLVMAAAFTLADVQLQRSGHRRGAKVLRITYTVIRVAAIAVNLRNARQR